MKNFKFSSLLLVPLFAVLAACGGGGGGSDSSTSTPAVTLKSIAVTSAQSTTMVTNTTAQLTATGTYSDGSTKALTSAVWAIKSGATTVAQVSSTGLVTAKGVGTETVTATDSGISGTIALSVIAPSPWTQVAAGGNQTIGLKTDGKLYSWGSNIWGQLGDGTSNDRTAPVTVSGNSTLWKQVAVGDQFAVAIRTDGTLWAWGYNLNGQLGDGTQTFRTTPVQIGTAKTWSYVSAGRAHVAALQSVTTTSGTTSTTVSTLYTWGSNVYGQLGDGTTVERRVPTKIGTANWLTVSAGDSHTVGIQSTNTLWGWGDASNGQVGNGATSGTVTAPVQIGTATWLTVAAGSFHTLAINTDSSLWAWGKGDSGQLGNNGSSLQPSPVPVGTTKNWARIAGGVSHSVGVQNDGTLWGWGSNAEGQLTNGNTDSLFPVQIGDLKTWKTVAAGAAHTVALRADSTLWTWGRNGNGQLGNGTVVNSATPVNVAY